MKTKKCLEKCKKAQVIFDEAETMNKLAAVNFLDKCITSVGLKSFGVETAMDPKLT